MINFVGGIFLLGGENLTRSDFDHSENCYLVEGMNLWWGRGGQKFGGGESTVGGMSKFLASGGRLPLPHPPSRENPPYGSKF